jgi:hypothetical protein
MEISPLGQVPQGLALWWFQQAQWWWWPGEPLWWKEWW